MPIGLLIFVLSFVPIGITVGPSLAPQARMQTISLASIDLPPTAIDLNMAAKRMEDRCSECWTVSRAGLCTHVCRRASGVVKLDARQARSRRSRLRPTPRALSWGEGPEASAPSGVQWGYYEEIRGAEPGRSAEREFLISESFAPQWVHRPKGSLGQCT